MGLDTRKPVFGVCEQQRLRPACADTQPDELLVIPSLESIMVYATNAGSLKHLLQVKFQLSS